MHGDWTLNHNWKTNCSIYKTYADIHIILKCLSISKCYLYQFNLTRNNIFDFSNLIKKATCFTKDALPTLIDVILTNKPNKCQNATNFNCGLSDYHLHETPHSWNMTCRIFRRHWRMTSKVRKRTSWNTKKWK
jgi:hypothetical protein